METEHRLGEYLKETKEFKVEPNIFHASEIGLCPRFIYFNKTNPLKDSFELKKMGLIGNIFHEFFEQKLYKDYMCEKNVCFESGNIKISGRADAYNETEVIDFKTCKDIKYIFKPKQEHIEQMNIYMKLLGLAQGKIIYISKHSLETREFIVYYDNKLFEKSLEKIKYLSEMIKSNSNPLNIKIQQTQQCLLCKYRKRCFE